MMVCVWGDRVLVWGYSERGALLLVVRDESSSRGENTTRKGYGHCTDLTTAYVYGCACVCRCSS